MSTPQNAADKTKNFFTSAYKATEDLRKGVNSSADKYIGGNRERESTGIHPDAKRVGSELEAPRHERDLAPPPAQTTGTTTGGADAQNTVHEMEAPHVGTAGSHATGAPVDTHPRSGEGSHFPAHSTSTSTSPPNTGAGAGMSDTRTDAQRAADLSWSHQNSPPDASATGTHTGYNHASTGIHPDAQRLAGSSGTYTGYSHESTGIHPDAQRAGKYVEDFVGKHWHHGSK